MLFCSAVRPLGTMPLVAEEIYGATCAAALRGLGSTDSRSLEPGSLSCFVEVMKSRDNYLVRLKPWVCTTDARARGRYKVKSSCDKLLDDLQGMLTSKVPQMLQHQQPDSDCRLTTGPAFAWACPQADVATIQKLYDMLLEVPAFRDTRSTTTNALSRIQSRHCESRHDIERMPFSKC